MKSLFFFLSSFLVSGNAIYAEGSKSNWLFDFCYCYTNGEPYPFEVIAGIGYKGFIANYLGIGRDDYKGWELMYFQQVGNSNFPSGVFGTYGRGEYDFDGRAGMKVVSGQDTYKDEYLKIGFVYTLLFASGKYVRGEFDEDIVYKLDSRGERKLKKEGLEFLVGIGTVLDLSQLAK